MRLNLNIARNALKGNLVMKKIKVYCIRCFWTLHVFEDAFGGIGIFDVAFGKNPLVDFKMRACRFV